MPMHVRLLSMSMTFRQGAKTVARREGQGEVYLDVDFPIPHYLAGHAIELALKAHLSHGGADEGDLIDLRHDLEKVMARADAIVLGVLGPEEIEAIRMLSPYYSGKRLEYPKEGTVGTMMTVPPVRYLLAAADKLIAHLDPIYRAEVAAARP
jgi:hypothetical protein